MGSHASDRRSGRVIAIDGPAASGKSSVARELARRLGFIYVNSGGFYRAITWYLLGKNIRPEENDRIAAALDAAALTCTVTDNESRILVNDMDPSLASADWHACGKLFHRNFTSALRRAM